jgi:hypothetical protein
VKTERPVSVCKLWEWRQRCVTCNSEWCIQSVDKSNHPIKTPSNSHTTNLNRDNMFRCPIMQEFFLSSPLTRSMEFWDGVLWVSRCCQRVTFVSFHSLLLYLAIHFVI